MRFRIKKLGLSPKILGQNFEKRTKGVKDAFLEEYKIWRVDEFLYSEFHIILKPTNFPKNLFF